MIYRGRFVQYKEGVAILFIFVDCCIGTLSPDEYVLMSLMAKETVLFVFEFF